MSVRIADHPVTITINIAAEVDFEIENGDVDISLSELKVEMDDVLDAVEEKLKNDQEFFELALERGIPDDIYFDENGDCFYTN